MNHRMVPSAGQLFADATPAHRVNELLSFWGQGQLERPASALAVNTSPFQLCELKNLIRSKALFAKIVWTSCRGQLCLCRAPRPFLPPAERA